MSWSGKSLESSLVNTVVQSSCHSRHERGEGDPSTKVLFRIITAGGKRAQYGLSSKRSMGQWGCIAEDQGGGRILIPCVAFMGLSHVPAPHGQTA